MVNTSIRDAFAQMWQYILDRFETKEDAALKLEETKAYAVNDYLNLYIWEKYDGEPYGYTLVNGTEQLRISYRESSPVPISPAHSIIYYSDSISVNGNEITLIDPTEVDIPAVTDNIGNTSVLNGKFIKIDKVDGYYFIPSDATISFYSGTPVFYFYTTNYQIVTPSSNKLGYVTSTSANTYPKDGTMHTDNCYYIGGKQIGDSLVKV